MLPSQVEGHWQWVKGLLDRSVDVQYMSHNEILELVAYLYKTGLEHGYKHALQDTAE